MGVMAKSFNKGLRYHLNSEPLAKMTLYGRGYLYSNVLLNIWITLAENLSTYSLFSLATSSISNQGTWKNFEPACGRINHCNAGKNQIFSDNCATWMIFYY